MINLASISLALQTIAQEMKRSNDLIQQSITKQEVLSDRTYEQTERLLTFQQENRVQDEAYHENNRELGQRVQNNLGELQAMQHQMLINQIAEALARMELLEQAYLGKKYPAAQLKQHKTHLELEQVPLKTAPKGASAEAMLDEAPGEQEKTAVHDN